MFVTIHLGNIYRVGELKEKATSKKSLLVQTEGGRSAKRLIDLYNLDAIIAVGYRVNSKKATQFRIWATKILHGYLVEGYALNSHSIVKSPEKIEGLHEVVALLESSKNPGRLKGKVIFKITKEMVNRE